MSLNSALVDRARRVYSSEQPGDWGEGEPSFDKDLRGPWFRARLTVHEPREQSPQGRGGYVFLQGDAELLFGVRDLEGGRMADETGQFRAWESDDALEVASANLGTRIWQINTGVEPIRKKRTVIGYKVGLVRVDDVTVDR